MSARRTPRAFLGAPGHSGESGSKPLSCATGVVQPTLQVNSPSSTGVLLPLLHSAEYVLGGDWLHSRLADLRSGDGLLLRFPEDPAGGP